MILERELADDITVGEYIAIVIYENGGVGRYNLRHAVTFRQQPRKRHVRARLDARAGFNVAVIINKARIQDISMREMRFKSGFSDLNKMRRAGRALITLTRPSRKTNAICNKRPENAGPQMAVLEMLAGG